MEVGEAYPCGCRFDESIGYRVSACDLHTAPEAKRRQKAAAALMDLGNWLDEGSKAKDPEHLSRALGHAADAAVKAAKALMEGE